MAIILNRPLSILPAKSVCHFTRPIRKTPSELNAFLSMNASIPSGVEPSGTTSSELITGHPMADSTMP